MGDGYLQSGCLKSKIRKSITYDKISDFFAIPKMIDKFILL